MRQMVWLVSLTVFVGLMSMSAKADAQANGVSDDRFAKLARGVNLSSWFWYPYEEPYTQQYISDEELAMLACSAINAMPHMFSSTFIAAVVSVAIRSTSAVSPFFSKLGSGSESNPLTVKRSLP